MTDHTEGEGDAAQESTGNPADESMETYSDPNEEPPGSPWWQSWWAVTIVAVALLAAGVVVGAIIGASAADNQDEVDEANVALDSAQEELSTVGNEKDDLETEIDTLESDVEQLDEDLAEVNDTVSETEAELAETEDSLAEAEAAAAKAEDERDAAIAESEELRQTYDPAIRGEAQAAYDAEAARACDAAKADVDASIESIVNWNDDWSLVSNEAELINAVTACSAEERSKTAEQRELDRLAGCVAVDPDAIEKDPDGQTGTCFVMYARIVQFDAATGTCSFHANISAADSDRSYDFDVRSSFGYDDDPVLATIVTDCPALDGIDVDDTVKVWAVGAGSFSYDTRIGGSNTVPVFRIEKVELVRKG